MAEHLPAAKSIGSIWLHVGGYFGTYVPYAALVKAMTSGLLPGVAPVDGLALLPISVLASAIAMFVTMGALGYFRDATKLRVGPWALPRPTFYTFTSGVATAVIVVTTTFAYTFEGVSIPLVMLLMRGGVLAIAPVVDVISGRRVAWYSWLALVLSLLGLTDGVLAIHAGAMPALLLVDILAYLLAYFVRLRLMAKLAKSTDGSLARRYFAEEQMVATPIAFALLGLTAAIASPLHALPALRAGFTSFWTWPAVAWLVVIGVCSQGTGFFGGLVLLDAREATYCVPLNRAGSILAGLVATAGLAYFTTIRPPSAGELLGAAALVLAIVVLWLGPRLVRRADVVPSRERKAGS